MPLFSHLVLLASLTAADVPPDSDVDALARTLRIQIYETFRADRQEFDRRRQTAQQVLDAWHTAGDRAEDRVLLVDWYRRAVRASQPGSIAPLPESPRFVAPVDTTTPAVGAPVVTPPSTIQTSPVETPYHPVAPVEVPPASVPTPPQPQPPPSVTDHARGPSKRHVQISLVELSARLAGYNRGVQTIESKLSESRVCTAADLAPLVRDLADLARRSRDLSLYRDYVVTDGERETLPTPTPLADVLALVGDRIFAARQATSAPDFIGGEAQRQAERNRLDALSRQLAEIATFEQTAASATHTANP